MRVALCISGEFRNREIGAVKDQLEHMRNFIKSSKMIVDTYVFSWECPEKEQITNCLMPVRYMFVKRKNFSNLHDKIKCKEENVVEGRDLGVLSMFYSMQQSYELIEDTYVYDYIVRIRPDVYIKKSLESLIEEVENNREGYDEIWFPKNFHAMGINDQFAIGTAFSMNVYFHTFDFLKEQISSIYFNPEYILLKNVRNKRLHVKLLDMKYVLMRFSNYAKKNIMQLERKQSGDWWSYYNHLPVNKVLDGFFDDKLKATICRGRKELPRLFYIKGNNKIIQFAFFDKSVNCYLVEFIKIGGYILDRNCDGVISEKYNYPSRKLSQEYVYVYRGDNKLNVNIYRGGEKSETMEYPVELISKGIYVTRFLINYIRFALGMRRERNSRRIFEYDISLLMRCYLYNSSLKNIYYSLADYIPFMKKIKKLLIKW